MRDGTAVAVLILLVGLAAGCGGGGSESPKASRSTAVTTTVHAAAPPTTVETTTAVRPAPTDAQVKDVFEAFINERASRGVVLAKSVTSVTVAAGVVTIALNAPPAVIEQSPFDNQAKLFGTPVAFNDDQGVWLRQTVQRVEVVDAAGKSLGSMTATELNKMGAG
jgi:hypothetical protein